MIELREIQGQQCVIRHLNDRYHQVSKAESTIVQVLWRDDGIHDAEDVLEHMTLKYSPDQPRGVSGEGTTPGSFVSTVTGAASDLAEATGNRSAVSEADLLSLLGPKERQKYNDAMKFIGSELKAGHATNKVHSVNKDGTGGYTDERKAVHAKLMDEYLSNADAARPAPGEQPTLMVLGGRGGSGKSQFNQRTDPKTGRETKDIQNPDGVYDPKKNVVLDCDEVKNMLAKADGFEAGAGNRAALYHKESDQVTIQIMKKARDMGLNVVIDATLKSRGKEFIAQTFINNGYRVEGYYMYLPRFKAAARGIKRYQEGGRLVPPGVILGNKNNERNFDRMTPMFDKWAVYNNDVARGEPAKLVAHGKK